MYFLSFIVELDEVCYRESVPWLRDSKHLDRLERSGGNPNSLPHAVTRCLSCQQENGNQRILSTVQPSPVSSPVLLADPAALQRQPHGLAVSLAGQSRNKGRSMRHLFPRIPLLLLPPPLIQHLERAPLPKPPPTLLFLHASDLRQPTYSVIGPPAQLPPTTVGALFPVDAHTKTPSSPLHPPQAAN